MVIFNNKESLFYTILVSFILDSLPSTLKKLKMTFENKNWRAYKDAAHQLKGSSGYCGAG